MRRAFRTLAISTTTTTLLLIAWGGLVRATGSGDGCPDWPTCFGSWIPRWEIHTVIEYIHRLLAVISGGLALALAVIAISALRGGRTDVAPRGALWAGVALAPAFAVQGALGGWVVASGLDPLVITLHFAAAFLILAAVVAITVATGSTRESAADAGLVRLADGTVAITYLLLLAGTYVRAEGAGLAFQDWPLMGGRLIPSLAPDGAFAMLLHRGLALVAASLVIWTAVRVRTTPGSSVRSRRLAAASIVVLVVQIVLGGINVVSEMAVPPRTAHVGVSALLWALVVAIAIAVRSDATAAEPEVSAETPTPAPALASTIGAFVALTKPRIIVLLLITTVPAMLLAAGEVPSLWLIAATLIGGSLAAASANAINMYLDRDIDEVMQRTKTRPLPGRRIRPETALRFGFVLGVFAFGFLALTVNVLAALLALSAIAFYVFVYTMWLKRATTQNIVIGGAAGAVPVLVGWAAVTGELAWPAWVLFAVIFVWTPPHFWALAMRVRDDYAAAGIPMLPVVRGEDETRRQILAYSVALVATTMLLAPAEGIGIIYVVAAIGLGAAFVGRALLLWRRPSESRAWGLFKYSIVYLGALFGAVAIDALV